MPPVPGGDANGAMEATMADQSSGGGAAVAMVVGALVVAVAVLGAFAYTGMAPQPPRAMNLRVSLPKGPTLPNPAPLPAPLPKPAG